MTLGEGATRLAASDPGEMQATRRAALTALLVALALAAPARAQEPLEPEPPGPVGRAADGKKTRPPPVVLRLNQGFEEGIREVCRPGRAFPVRVSLAETRGQRATGEVQLYDGDRGVREPGRPLCRLAFDLEPQGRSVRWVDVLLPPGGSSHNLYGRVIADTGEVLSDDLAVVAGRKDTQDRLIVAAGYAGREVLTTTLAKPFDFVDEERRGVNRDNRVVLHGKVENLPATALALDGIDAVAIPAPLLAGLPADRRAVLAGFVEGGGTLLVTAGPGTANAVRRDDLGDLLPVAPAPGEGEGQVIGEEGLAWAGLHAVSTPLTTTLVTPRPGAYVLVAGEKEQPLLVTRRRGLGRVTFLAFAIDDPAVFGRGRGWAAFGRLLLPPSARPPIVRPASDAPEGPADPLGELDLALKRQVGIPTPPVSEPLSVLALYFLCLFPGAVVVARLVRRLELFWAALPVLALGFSLLLGAKARRLYEKQTGVVIARVVELGSGASGGPARTLATLIHPGRHRFVIDLPKGELLQPFGRTMPHDNLELEWGPGGQRIHGFELLIGQPGLLDVRGHASLGGPFDATLEVGAQRSLLLRNDTQHELVHGRVVLREGFLPVPPLRPGEATRVALGDGATPARGVQPDPAPIPETLAAVTRAVRRSLDPGGVRFVARTEQGPGYALVLDGAPAQVLDRSTCVVVTPRLVLAAGPLHLARLGLRTTRLDADAVISGSLPWLTAEKRATRATWALAFTENETLTRVLRPRVTVDLPLGFDDGARPRVVLSDGRRSVEVEPRPEELERVPGTATRPSGPRRRPPPTRQWSWRARLVLDAVALDRLKLTVEHQGGTGSVFVKLPDLDALPITIDGEGAP